MRKNNHDEKVYHYLLECFYFKVYRYGEVLPMQSELAKQYKVSLQSIKKAMAKLAQAQLVESRKSAGTVCKFDFTNEKHLSLVAFNTSNANKKTYSSYYFPSDFLFYIASQALYDCSPKQRSLMKQSIKQIIACDKDVVQRTRCIAHLQLLLVECLKSNLLKSIAHHFFTQYLFFHMYEEFSEQQVKQLQTISEKCFTSLFECIENHHDEQAANWLKEAYTQTYAINHVFSYHNLNAFALLSRKHNVNEEVCDYLLSQCFQNQCESGMLIGTEIHMAKQLNLSMHTLKKAMSYLCEKQFVRKEKAKGIVLHVDATNEQAMLYIQEVLDKKKKAFFDALTLIASSNMYYCKQMLKQIEQIDKKKIEEHFTLLLKQNHQVVLAISPNVVVALLTQTEQCEIMQHYYTYVCTYIEDMMTLFGKKRLQQLFVTHQQTIKEVLSNAMLALMDNNYTTFIHTIQLAQQQNYAFLEAFINGEIEQFIKRLTQKKKERSFYLDRTL